jgi:DNA polymerase-3 subunit epsilon
VREIVFDTETTGTDASVDRIVEVGAVEIVDLIPTGRTFHSYINPGRQVSPGAFRVHGLSNEFLKGHPSFRRVAPKFLAFIGGDRLVAHNAGFDVRFLNAELQKLGLPPLDNPIIDTLEVARKVKRGGQHNLDALCRHFNIDSLRRTKHGALLDSEILAEVYLHLNGGRQFGMALSQDVEEKVVTTLQHGTRSFTVRSTPAELEAHAAFVDGLGAKAVWNRYQGEETCPA